MTTSSPGVRRWIKSVSLFCASSIVTAGMVIGSRPGTSFCMIRTRNALFYQTLLTKLLADGRPFVLAVHEVVPVGLGLLPGDEFPERGDVQDHAVVEVRVEVEVRRPAELVLDVPEFREEGVLAVDVLVDLLGPLGGGAE